MTNNPATASVDLGPTTKQRILVAFERLVARKGFDGVSLRDLTAAARVNLAAVNYYYGSREGLEDTLLTLYVEPLNLERIRLLDALEKEYGQNPVALDRIIEAMVSPVIRNLGNGNFSGIFFLKLMARCIDAHEHALPESILKPYKQAVARYVQAFHRALPSLSEKTIVWRIHFIFGAVNHTLANDQNLYNISRGRSGPADPEFILRSIVAFASAGFRAAETEASAPEDRSQLQAAPPAIMVE